jgi:hypothetical protein
MRVATMKTIPIFLVCLAGFMASLATNYPGFMSYDPGERLLDAKAGVYSDWHPPLMAVIWHFTDRVVPGPFGMLIFETGLLWSGTFLVTLTWFTGGRFALLWSVAPSLLLFYPPVFTISGVIWKDILMLAFLIMAIGVAGSIRALQKWSWAAGAKFTIAAAMLFLAILVRHNAIFATVPIMALCVARLIGKRHFQIAISVSVAALICCAMLFCSARVDHALASYQRSPWASAAIYDIAGIIYRIPDRQQQESYYMSIPPRLRGTGSVDRLLSTYDSSYWQTMYLDTRPAFACPTGEQSPSRHHLSMMETCFELTEEEGSALRQLWETAVIHHPVAWLFHRMSVFRQVIGLHRQALWSPVFMQFETGFSKDVVAQIYGQRPPELNKFQSWAKWHFERLAKWWFYRPWVYLALTMCILVLCVSSRANDRLEIALIAASGLAHEVGLFLLAPSADYRYSHYMIYASVLASMLWVRAELSVVRRSSPAELSAAAGSSEG